MKYYYVLALLLGYSSCVLAEECMDNSNIDSLREVFKKNNKKLLIEMSSKEMRRYVESDLLIKNKYSTLVNVSEVYYGWGVDKKSKYPVNTSAVFPNEKVCVWNVSFALPESIRKNVMMMVLMGILLNLRKLMGKQLYITLPLCLILFPTEL
ncbi:sugar ABC transporter permease [Klebsiella pneumoniae]